jgi:hypothetical protein
VHVETLAVIADTHRRLQSVRSCYSPARSPLLLAGKHRKVKRRSYIVRTELRDELHELIPALSARSGINDLRARKARTVAAGRQRFHAGLIHTKGQLS